MTAINIYRRPDVVWLFGDGASYDADGRLSAITGKIHVLASLSCALLFSGRSIISPYIAHMLERAATDFDHMMEILPGWLPGMVDELTDLFGRDDGDVAQLKDAAQGFRIFVAGWSAQRGETVAFTVSSIADASGPPFAIAEGKKGFQAPGVSAEENALGFGVSPNITPETINDVAVTILELQRQQRDAEGKSHVGGLVELVTVTRDGVTSKILKRWDEDLVGELIQPRPVDWAAWRARHGQAVTKPVVQLAPPSKLSRHERRAADARGRKA